MTYLKLALALLLLGGGAFGVWSYRHAVQRAEAVERRLTQAEADRAALQRQLDTLSKETVRRAEFDAALRVKRAAISHNLDTATREDPASADYLRERIPQRVRDAYLQDTAAAQR